MSPKDLLTNAVIKAVKRHLPFPHYQVFYFGSQATGKATPRSDFDIGLKAEHKIPLEVIAKIREDLEAIAILQKIDLIDFASVSEQFLREATEAAKIIYEQ